MPPFATGKIVSDYSPLFKYWRQAASEGRQDLVDKSMLNEDDFEFVRRLVKDTASLTLLELMDALKNRFEDRVDPGVASRALGVPEDVAVEVMTSTLAGWLVEAAESFKMVSVRFKYRMPED